MLANATCPGTDGKSYTVGIIFDASTLAGSDKPEASVLGWAACSREGGRRQAGVWAVAAPAPKMSAAAAMLAGRQLPARTELHRALAAALAFPSLWHRCQTIQPPCAVRFT